VIARKPFVIFLTIVVVLILLPVLASAENIPAKDTPEWIEYTLDLDHQVHTWTYNETSKTYTLSVVSAVANPVLPDYEGVSVCVPGVYVKGLDTEGNLIIDYNAKFVNPNGVTYTAATAPVILETGAAGYGSQRNGKAGGNRAQYGYIDVSIGNRGKQSSVKDANGKLLYYTGDAPSCLVDQKAAARWVKYNILLKNLPGSIDRFVSTGGSGGAAHATMFAATSNNPDFYPYQAEVGAVGVYKDAKTGKYVAALINGIPLSDGAWGSEGYSTISSLYEADAAQAFEYHLWPSFPYKSPFQAKLAEYLAEEYMNYINSQNLVVNGKKLSIQYDLKKHPDTNGYYGTYLDYMLDQFHKNLEWYLNNLKWSSSWTKDDPTMTDVEAFLKGAYSYQQTGRGGGGPGRAGGPPSGGPGGDMAGGPGGDMAGGPGGAGGPDAAGGGSSSSGTATTAHGKDVTSWVKYKVNKDGTYSVDFSLGDMMAYRGAKMNKPVPSFDVITYNQEDWVFGNAEKDARHFSVFVNNVFSDPAKAAVLKPLYSTTDSKQYLDANGKADFDAMIAAHKADIAEIAKGDKYGKNIVDLYNPVKYIGAKGTENPRWSRIMMGGVEGDIALLCSMNISIKWMMAGVKDVILQWQWNGGHVPSDIFSMSFAGYVDQMLNK
jgi:hypothetical protein